MGVSISGFGSSNRTSNPLSGTWVFQLNCAVQATSTVNLTYKVIRNKTYNQVTSFNPCETLPVCYSSALKAFELNNSVFELLTDALELSSICA